MISGRLGGLAVLVWLAACSAIPLVGADEEEQQATPNVVLVFVDDLGWGDLSCYGATEISTPNLDRLAAEGVRFTDFYVSQPVCSASRASLLTGCYANRIGIHGALGPNSPIGIATSETTLAELCRSRGYATAIFGKWHLGHRPEFLPTRHGFDHWYGIPYSNDMWPFHPDGPKPWRDLPTFEDEDVVGLNTDQSRFTTDLTERAVAFIDACAQSGRPFFLYLPHPMPHVPLAVSERFRGHSRQGLYGDVVEELDWSVGQIVAALERHGLRQDTLVMFISDNGPWLSYGNHAGSTGGLREGKGTTFEGGVRVPFIASWPGHVPAGRVVSEPAMTIDVLPTVARLIEAEPPPLAIDGGDMTPLLLGQPGARSPRETYFFWYHQGELEALRSGRWKLHFPHRYRSMEGRTPGRDGRPGRYDYSRETPLALFDLWTDPAEAHDVKELHPEVVRQLSARADAERALLGDRLTGVSGSAVRPPGRVEP